MESKDRTDKNETQINSGIFHNTFVSFEEYLIKNKFVNHPPEEIELIYKKNSIDYFLEFNSFEERTTFIGEYAQNWINPLEGDKSENNYKINQDQNNLKQVTDIEIEFIVAYKYIPIVWVKSTYYCIEKIREDVRINLFHGNLPIYLCLHALHFQFSLDQIHESFFQFTGKGVKIGLIDAGVDSTHPDLNGQIIDILNVSNEDTGDYNGHGTFLAGILVGTGKESEGYYRGICPGAKLIDIKVFNEEGHAKLSDLLLALDLLIDRSEDNRPDILVFGCTTGNKDSPSHILSKMTTIIFNMGISIVVPTGNHGPDPGYMGSPSLSKNVLTIGTVSEDNKIVFFSGRMKRETFSGKNIDDNKLNEVNYIKPDLVVPGTKIIASKAFVSRIGENEDVSAEYMKLTGTSISAAIAAGLLALLKQAFPSLKPIELYKLIINDTFKLPQISEFSQGNGIPLIKKCLKEYNLLYKKPISFREMKRKSMRWSILTLSIFIIIFILFWG